MNKPKKNSSIVTGSYGRMKPVADFLPSPEELVIKEDKTVKVTLNLTKTSVDFFKSQASKFWQLLPNHDQKSSGSVLFQTSLN